MADCKHDCETSATFPHAISNRPALNEIAYRIGTYSRMRAHLLDELNRDETLKAWTHRGADDPGIALLEGDALVGDILTFYQNVYANEAFLRTADWRESVSELVQLTGYRLAPGVGGEATFALKVKGDVAVTVPKGFGFKAQLKDRAATDEFESASEILAYPHLGEFNLYRPPGAMQNISAGGDQLELHAVDGAEDFSSLQSIELNPGDRILLVPDSSMFDDDGMTYTTQDKPELLIVSRIETVLNRVILTLEGELRIDRDSTIRAYKIDRTFRHFGYNAPRRLTDFDGAAVSLSDTEFERVIKGSHAGADYYSSFDKEAMPLDQEVDDLALGGKLIVQSISNFDDYSVSPSVAHSDQPFIVVKTIEETTVDTLQWGHVEGSTTVVIVDDRLLTNDDLWNEAMDIRRTLFHETISPELTLRAPTQFADGDFIDGELQFFGTYSEMKALAERDLLLADADNGSVQAVTTTSTLADFETQLADRDEDEQWLWTLTVDQIPEFERDAFDQAAPRITVYGNLIETDQGKTEDEVVLGSGDHRETFQTFAVPKTPLTYLLDESQTPAPVPELDVYVDGILWERIDNFFNSGAEDQVYVVREDSDGNSYIQFGDGKTGARLASGIKNVVAIYRTGSGAAGVLEDGKKPAATGKLSQLGKVSLPGEVVGGDEAESADNAREAAPGSMQSLGRLVSVADFEAEALAVPGVLKVSAAWAAPSGTPVIQIVVLTASGTSAAVDQVQKTLSTYNRCRGPSRFPILVEQGLLQYLYLNVRVSYEASRRQADIEMAVKLALGLVGEEGDGVVTGDGLFPIEQRRFGQGAHRSQILAAIQQVEGVVWVEVDDAQAVDLGDPPETDPNALAKPDSVSASEVIGCESTRILALHASHLDFSLVMDETSGECE